MSLERMNEIHIATTCGMCAHSKGNKCDIFNLLVETTHISCEHFQKRDIWPGFDGKLKKQEPPTKQEDVTISKDAHGERFYQAFDAAFGLEAIACPIE